MAKHKYRILANARNKEFHRIINCSTTGIPIADGSIIRESTEFLPMPLPHSVNRLIAESVLITSSLNRSSAAGFRMRLAISLALIASA